MKIYIMRAYKADGNALTIAFTNKREFLETRTAFKIWVQGKIAQAKGFKGVQQFAANRDYLLKTAAELYKDVFWAITKT